MNNLNFGRKEQRRRLIDTSFDTITSDTLKMGRRGIRRHFSTKGKTTALDRRNEGLSEDNVTLHATKGYRSVTVKRSRAELIVALIKRGSSFPNFRIKETLLNA